MKGWTLRLIVAAVIGGVGSPAEADAPLVHCVGTESGGDGPRQYAYSIDAASFPMMDFRVPTNDLDAANYTDVLMPDGWSFRVEPEPGSHAHGVKTPHGEISSGPCRCLTPGSVRWWTEDPGLAVESFTFAYDHPWPSEDVGWILKTQRPGPTPQTHSMQEVWDSPAGSGYGPVHGPVPEPSTLLLLSMGAVGLLLYARRHRKKRGRESFID